MFTAETQLYTDNAFGKPKTITAAGATTTMQYNVYGNQIKLIDPDAGTTDYKYNAFGELTYQKDANNNTFTLLYNNKGQLTHKNCNSTQFSTTYTYYINGMLQKETLGNGNSKEYFYNNKGQLTKLNEKIDGAIYSHEYTYDTHGNVLTYKYPSGYTITNEYNTYGYKTGVKEGNTYIWKVSGSDYVNEMGQLKEYLLGPNNIKTKREYVRYKNHIQIQEDFGNDKSRAGRGRGNYTLSGDTIKVKWALPYQSKCYEIFSQQYVILNDTTLRQIWHLCETCEAYDGKKRDPIRNDIYKFFKYP